MAPVLTGRRERAREADAALSADEAAMRAEAASNAAELRALESALYAAEGERDAAHVLLEAAKLRGDTVAQWRQEQAYEDASATVVELVARRVPLAEKSQRLNGYLAPLDAARAQLDEHRRALVAWEAVMPAVKALDDLIRAVDAATEAGKGAGPYFTMPGPLVEIARRYGPGGMRRATLDYALSGADGLAAKVRRLEAGESA